MEKRTQNTSLFVLLVALYTCSVAQDVSCPDGMESYIIDFDTILEVQDEVEQAKEAGDTDAKPYLKIQLKPNNFDYPRLDALSGFRKSGTFVWLRGWDSYHIEPNKKSDKFLVKYVVVESRDSREVIIEFFASEPGKKSKKVYTDKREPGSKIKFEPSVFPHTKSELEFYSLDEPYPLDKIRIAFRRTVAEDNIFGVKNLVVVTCVGSRIV